MVKLKAQFLKIEIDDAGLTPRDVSADVDSIEFPNDHEDIDVTGFTDTVVNELPGMLTAPITLTGTFNAAADTGLFTVLDSIRGVYAGHTVTIGIGQNAAPTAGDPEYEGEYWCKSLNVSGTPRGKLVINAELRNFGGTTAPDYGTVT